MLAPSALPQVVNTILITRLDGLGDIVQGTMLLSGLHRRWPGAYIKMLVRPQMAGVSGILPKWVRVIPLSFDPRQPVVGREPMLAEQLRNIAEDCQADLTLVAEYNRVWASELLATMAASETVMTFNGPTGLNPNNRAIAEMLDLIPPDDWQQVRVDKDWREPAKYAAMLNALGLDPTAFLPGGLVIRPEDQNAADELWRQLELEAKNTIILFPGRGNDWTRTLPPATWAKWAVHLSDRQSVLLLGGEVDRPMVETIAGSGIPNTIKHLVLPMERIGALACLLDTAAAFIGPETGPMHIAAALGRPTLGVFGGGHRGERFLPVGRRAAAVRMPIGCYGCDWECPFDTKLCLSHMPAELLLAAGDTFLESYLSNGGNADPLSPQIYDLPASADLPAVLLGPMMRLHRSMQSFRQEVAEQSAHAARVNQDRQARVSEMGDALSSITNILSEMSRQNRTRDETVTQIKSALSILAQHTQKRAQ